MMLITKKKYKKQFVGSFHVEPKLLWGFFAHLLRTRKKDSPEVAWQRYSIEALIEEVPKGQSAQGICAGDSQVLPGLHKCFGEALGFFVLGGWKSVEREGFWGR